jgi:hypothetical protein
MLGALGGITETLAGFFGRHRRNVVVSRSTLAHVRAPARHHASRPTSPKPGAKANRAPAAPLPVRNRVAAKAAPTPTRRSRERRPDEHHTIREHADLVVRYAQAHVDPRSGFVFHDHILELYTEALIEAGWRPRSWNPIAREVDLITTGGKKPYQWVFTDSGVKRRRRVYPIPQHMSVALGEGVVDQGQSERLAA